ncbi:MAG: homocysteine S-methyltransferase family protein [Nocardiopsaceae bacterium]|nr:homocysteine S-methyltransferase family protein [Nocardiopsaceae bacterium]
MPDEEPGAPDVFQQLVEAYANSGQQLAAVTLMHVALDVVPDGLEIVRRYFPQTPIGVYAEVGSWQAPVWVFDDLSPEAYLAEAKGWADAGVQLIGSCCGSGPEFVQALAGGLPKGIPSRRGAGVRSP